MPEEASYPFHSLSFTLIEGTKPRALFRMKRKENGMYELHVERGSAANPSSQFTREVPVATAQGLKDALQEIGVFAWDESYPDSPGAPARRWTLSTVFKKDVFSVSSKGGSDVPVGFEILLEELYKLDFPRPDASRTSATTARQGIGLGTALNSMGSLGLGKTSRPFDLAVFIRADTCVAIYSCRCSLPWMLSGMSFTTSLLRVW